MAGLFTIIGEKLGIRGDGGGGGGDKIQYLLAGTLVLVIIISLIAAITTFSGGGKRSKVSRERRFYDLETKEEFTLDPKDMMGGPGGPGEMMMDPGMMGGPGMRVINPKTGKRTAVPMTKCPKCEQWFVPESMLSENPQEHMMRKIVCTECGTDIVEFHRQKRRNRKKKK